MSKEAENIISLINKGILPPINQNETFGINTSTHSSSNKSEVKKQAYKEFAERIIECCAYNNDLSADAWLSITTGINCVLKEMICEEEE